MEIVLALSFSKIAFEIRKGKAKRAKKVTKGHAMNAEVTNSVVDQQKIRTAEIEIPVIAEDVLTYEGGELGPSYPDKTRLFYPADAIKDPEYLETVRRSPIQVQTHQKNTSEYNRDVDGWPTEVWWNDDEKRVMVKGVLHGEENVKYAEENKHLPGFGTSAFISFLRIEKESGTAPNGKPFDAVVRKAVNNHIAILPGIRDPKNVIVAMNAVEAETVEKPETLEKKVIAINSDTVTTVPEGKRMPIDKADFKEAMQAYMAEEAEKDATKEEIKNKVLNELQSSGPGEEKKPVTSTASGGNAPESSAKPVNAETSTAEEKKEEAATASNALPSEEMVKDFSTHLGITFPKVPSLPELGSLVGIKATEPAELISALNAKREEFKTRTTKVDARNSTESLADLMRVI